MDFVRANTSPLMRTAYLLTGSAPAAEELVQDTLLRLYPQWGRVVKADVPIVHVRRSLTTHFLNQRRRVGGRRTLIDAVPDRPEQRGPELVGLGQCGPEQDLFDRDDVWAMLFTLAPRRRAALVLRYYEGLSVREIATALGCRPGTARSLISRGLADLRGQQLGEAHHTPTKGTP